MEGVCATCLTVGRRLAPLKTDTSTFRTWFGVNIEDPICWECQATLFKFISFRNRVIVAQDMLQKCEANLKSLSQLSYVNKDSYDEIIIQGIKTEVFECVFAHYDTQEQDIKLENDDSKTAPPNSKHVVTAQPSIDIEIKVETLKEKAKKQPERYYTVKQLTMKEVEQIRSDDRATKKYANSLYKCETCIIRYGTKVRWEYHNRLHRETSGSHICNLCQQRFMHEDLLKDHFNTHFKCYVCRYCDFTTTRFHMIQSHYYKNHKKDVYHCEKCSLEFPTRTKLTYHEKTSHRDLLICPVADCMKRLKTEFSFKCHMLRHNGGTPQLECSVCHKLLKGVYSLRTHMKTHTDPPPPPTELPYCVTCDKQFNSRSNYDQHMKLSAPHRNPDVFKFQCADCGKQYIHKHFLEDHVLSVHLNRREFLCNVCNKTFNTIGLLNRHRKSHDGPRRKIRDKVCEQCGKAFMIKKTLDEHMNSHTGARPYECQVCGDRFSYSAALFNHNRLKHENFKQKKKTKFEK